MHSTRSSAGASAQRASPQLLYAARGRERVWFLGPSGLAHSCLPHSFLCPGPGQVLDVSFNRLRSLPATLSALTSLVELDARANLLTALDSASLSAWRSLTRLSLHRNELQELPDAFGSLTSLAVLDCRHVAAWATLTVSGLAHSFVEP